jgi:acyl-CoA thioesterase
MSDFVSEIPFVQHLGMKALVSDNGYSEIRLDIRPELLQRMGYVHGGAIATLIDTSIGHAIYSTMENGGAVTIELKVNYLRPAQGTYLLAKTSLYHRGNTTAVGKTEVYDDQGKLVAVGMGTFMLLKPEDHSPANA